MPAAAQAVDEKIRQGPLPAGRNVHFPDPTLRKQFTDWLAQKGIQHQVVHHARRGLRGVG